MRRASSRPRVPRRVSGAVVLAKAPSQHDNPGMPKAVATWTPDPSEDERLLTSAIAVIEFARTSRALHPDHPRRLVNEALWFWTERGRVSRKYQIRYRTPAAVKLQADLGMSAAAKHLAHEHVHPRSTVVTHLLRPDANVRATLVVVQGCVVTREEHARLGEFKSLNGWIRYLKAGIAPLDLETDEPLDLPALIAADERFWDC